MLYIELSNTHPAAYNLTHVTSDAHTVFFRDFCLLQPSPVFLSRHVYFSVYFLNSNTPPTPDPRTRLVNTHTDTHGLHPYLRLLISTAVVFSFPTPLARSPPFVVFPPQIAFSLLLNSSQAHSSPSIFHTSRVSLISCSQHHILPPYSSLSLSLSRRRLSLSGAHTSSSLHSIPSILFLFTCSWLRFVPGIHHFDKILLSTLLHNSLQGNSRRYAAFPASVSTF